MIFIVVGAILLLWTPLVNGYPFLHADSGTYIWSSVIFLVPADRPIGYGLFIRAVSLAPTLWVVVVAQALGTSYLMLRVAEHFLPRTPRRVGLAFGVVMATIALSTVSLVVGFILADIFAAWLWLGTLLFFVTRHTFERVLAAFAILLGVWTHNSHVALALLLLGGALVFFLPRWRADFGKRALWYSGTIVFALASMMVVNVYLRADAAPARGTETIWLNRFHELGVLRMTLEQNCAAQTWTLCEALELIRAHDGEWRWFLFDAASPIHAVGWEKETAEQRAVVLRTLECCWQQILFGSLAETWRQFWTIEMQNYIAPLAENMNAMLAIEKNYPGELAAFRATRQQRGEFMPAWLLPISERVMLSVWLVVLVGIFVIALWRRQRARAALLVSTLAFVILNALIMATFSGAATRYQARVVWLIPFVVWIAASALIASRKPLE